MAPVCSLVLATRNDVNVFRLSEVHPLTLLLKDHELSPLLHQSSHVMAS